MFTVSGQLIMVTNVTRRWIKDDQHQVDCLHNHELFHFIGGYAESSAQRCHVFEALAATYLTATSVAVISLH